MRWKLVVHIGTKRLITYAQFYSTLLDLAETITHKLNEPVHISIEPIH